MRLAICSTIAATFLGCATTTPSPPPAAPPPVAPVDCAAAWQPTSAGDAPLPDALDKNAIVAGMASVKACVEACAPPEKRHWYSDTTPATARFSVKVTVTIANTGQPIAQVVSRNIPQPLSDCIAAAVEKASFPPFTGKPMVFVYPYLIY